jgi:hypothetical protein
MPTKKLNVDEIKEMQEEMQKEEIVMRAPPPINHKFKEDEFSES